MPPIAPHPTATPSLSAPKVEPNLFEPIDPQTAFAQNMARPILANGLTVAAPFAFPPKTSETTKHQALDCLSQAIYYEAGNQGAQGMRAVAQVVLNRVRSPLFPHSVCAVVYQGSQLPTGCQFTFTCDGSLLRRPMPSGWSRVRAIAEAALHGSVEPSVGTATNYHTVYVVPYWAETLQKIAMVGQHLFYRLPGRLGTRAGFTSPYLGEELNASSIPLIETAGGTTLDAKIDEGHGGMPAVGGSPRALQADNAGALAVEGPSAPIYADMHRGRLKIDDSRHGLTDPRGTPAP